MDSDDDDYSRGSWYEYLQLKKEEQEINYYPTYNELIDEFNKIKKSGNRTKLWTFLNEDGFRLLIRDKTLRENVSVILEKCLKLKQHLSDEEQLAVLNLTIELIYLKIEIISQSP